MSGRLAQSAEVLRRDGHVDKPPHGPVEACVQPFERGEFPVQKRIALTVEERQNLRDMGGRASCNVTRPLPCPGCQCVKQGFSEADPPLRGQRLRMFPTQQGGELFLSGATTEGTTALTEACMFQHFLDETGLQCARGVAQAGRGIGRLRRGWAGDWGRTYKGHLVASNCSECRDADRRP